MPFAITPSLIDLILVGVAAEFVALAAWLARRSAARWIWPLALYLGSGAALMLALRAALASADAQWIALPLAASFFAHAGSLLAVLRIRAGSAA
jgi:hypothetical protein